MLKGRPSDSFRCIGQVGVDQNLGRLYQLDGVSSQ